MANLTEIFKFLKKESVKITNSGPMDVNLHSAQNRCCDSCNVILLHVRGH